MRGAGPLALGELRLAIDSRSVRPGVRQRRLNKRSSLARDAERAEPTLGKISVEAAANPAAIQVFESSY